MGYRPHPDGYRERLPSAELRMLDEQDRLYLQIATLDAKYDSLM